MQLQFAWSVWGYGVSCSHIPEITEIFSPLWHVSGWTSVRGVCMGGQFCVWETIWNLCISITKTQKDIQLVLPRKVSERCKHLNFIIGSRVGKKNGHKNHNDFDGFEGKYKCPSEPMLDTTSLFLLDIHVFHRQGDLGQDIMFPPKAENVNFLNNLLTISQNLVLMAT